MTDTIKDLITNEFKTTERYSGAHIANRMNSILKTHDPETVTVESLKKGDVVKLQEGVKSRPCVIIKVNKLNAVYIPLTSSINVHTTVSKYKSRFFGEGHFSKALSVVDIEDAKSRFVGVLDDPKALNEAIKEVTSFYSGVLK